MLTIAECQELLGADAPESDEDVAMLRDLVAILVGSVLDSLPPAKEER